ncbi:hypothetical protein ACHAW6_014772, partial [Cyclotella cf. meneghiniana]
FNHRRHRIPLSSPFSSVIAQYLTLFQFISKTAASVSLFLTISKMKNCQILILAAIVATVSAFAPIVAPTTRSPMKSAKATPLAMVPKDESSSQEKQNAAAIAAFATAMAPFAAHAADIDEGVVIGYGAGLVACVVSLAVGFAIGYGTLVKP